MNTTSQLIAGRFEISNPQKDLLGRGGMPNVYRGADTLSGETFRQPPKRGC